MTIQDKKKKTVGIAIAAVGAAAIALGAGTFASFSSTQDGPDTTLAAGELDFGDSKNEVVELKGFVPGGKAQTRKMTFKNSDASSLRGDLSLAFELAEALDNGCSGDEESIDRTCATADQGELQDKLLVEVTRGDTVLYPEGKLSGLNGITSVNTPDVAPKQTVTYTFKFRLPEGGSGDNEVQGDSVKLLTKATLVQSAQQP